MSADADRRDEPTVEFVPTWDDEEPTGTFTPTRNEEATEPAPVVTVRGTPSEDILPARERRPGPARREPIRREPAHRAPPRREPAHRAPTRREPAGRALARARSAVGLLILVVVGGVGLAGAIGAFVLAVTFALQRAAGG